MTKIKNLILVLAPFLVLIVAISRIPIDLEFSNVGSKRENKQLITIKKIDNDGSIIELCFPEKKIGGRLKYTDGIAVKGEWYACSFSDRICTKNKGSSISFSIDDGIPLVLLKRADGGIVEINTDLNKDIITTQDANYSFFEYIPSGKNSIQNLSIPAFEIKKIQEILKEKKNYSKYVTIKSGYIYLYNGSIDKLNINSVEEKFLNKFILEELLINIFIIIKILFVIIFLLFSSMVIGSLVLSKFKIIKFEFYKSIVIGFGIQALLINSSLYFFTANLLVAPYIILLLMATYLFMVNKNYREVKLDSISLSFLLIILIIFLQPVLFSGNFGLAYLQTDIGFYTSIAEHLKRQSYFEMASDFGFSHRSIDTGVASLISSLSGESTGFSWIALCGFLLLMFSLSISKTLKLTTNSNTLKYLGLLLGGLSPQILGVYYEGYLSQFFFTCLIWSALGVIFSINFNTKMSRFEIFQKMIISAIVLSTPLMAYPQFSAILILSLILSFVVINIKNIKNIAVGIFIYTISTILLCNIGLFSLSVGNKFDMTVLNGIAKNIVFPFMNTGKAISIGLGLLPFHSNQLYLNEYFSQGIGYLKPLILAVSFLSNDTLCAVMLMLSMALIFAFIYSNQNKIFIRIFYFIFLFLSLGILAKFFFNAEWYAYAKYGFFISSALPIIILSSLHYIGRSKNLIHTSNIKLRLWIGNFCIVIYSVSILSSGLYSNIYWYASQGSQNGPIALHYRDVNKLIILVKNGDSKDYLFKTSKLRNDKDLMVMSLATSFLSNLGYKCINCSYRDNGEFFWVKEFLPNTKSNIIDIENSIHYQN